MRVFAFLRAINVGGRRPKSPELIEAVSGPGVADAATFMASGNLSFVTDLDPDLAALTATIEARLEATLGYAVTTFLRTRAQLDALVADLPPLDSDDKHQVLFFASEPDAATRERFRQAAGPTDRLRWRPTEVVWTHRGGMLDSPLGEALPKLSPPPNTVRTANTVERMLAKFP